MNPAGLLIDSLSGSRRFLSHCQNPVYVLENDLMTYYEPLSIVLPLRFLLQRGWIEHQPNLYRLLDIEAKACVVVGRVSEPARLASRR